MKRNYFNLFYKVAKYKISRSLDLDPPLPINMTVSVTNACNSECKTCFIWKLYRDQPELRHDELKTWEFVKIFESIGKAPVWFTFSGGEPFLRKDIAEICMNAWEICSPWVISIPTNSLSPSIIESETKRILEKAPGINVIINQSLDGVGEGHDIIRGIQGNFEKFKDTYLRLKSLKEEFPNLSLGVHSVISRYNIGEISELYEFVKKLHPDSYISEIAENRSELLNINTEITPEIDTYAKLIEAFSSRIKEDYVRSRGVFQRATQAFRIVYYEKLSTTHNLDRQLIPCYAGYASCQITPFGDVWPCCVLGYNKPMGNLRETEYDFKKVWYSDGAREVRKFIRGGSCGCPLANAYYTNILCSYRDLLKVLWFLLKNV